jgi:hypothetical protein
MLELERGWDYQAHRQHMLIFLLKSNVYILTSWVWPAVFREGG